MNYRIGSLCLVGALLTVAGCNWGFMKSRKELFPIKYRMESVKDVVQLFDYDEETVKARTNEMVTWGAKQVEELLAISDNKRTYENTAHALGVMLSKIGSVHNVFKSLALVAPCPKLRKAVHEAQGRLQESMIGLILNVDVYNAFKSYVDGSSKNENLSAERQYYLEEQMQAFKLCGSAVPADKLQDVKTV